MISTFLSCLLAVGQCGPGGCKLEQLTVMPARAELAAAGPVLRTITRARVIVRERRIFRPRCR